MAKKHRKPVWVVKVGSAIFMDGGPILVLAWMQQLKILKQKYGISVIWVTSGAISSAQGHLRKQKKNLAEKQALSAIGQPMLMNQYNLALQSLGLLGAQVLLSYSDIRHKTGRENLKSTLNTLLKWGIVPILNENDAVATDEIQFGDNDTLSAMVATLISANRLVVMTNVDGYFDGDFSTPVRHLAKVTRRDLAKVKRAATSKVGTGGMFSKLKAAQVAQNAGIETWLLKGSEMNGLLRVAQNHNVGTRIGGRK